LDELSELYGNWHLYEFVNKDPECKGVSLEIVNLLKYYDNGTFTQHLEDDSILGNYRLEPNRIIYAVEKDNDNLIENQDYLIIHSLSSDTLSLEILSECGMLYAVYLKEKK